MYGACWGPMPYSIKKMELSFVGEDLREKGRGPGGDRREKCQGPKSLRDQFREERSGLGYKRAGCLEVAPTLENHSSSGCWGQSSHKGSWASTSGNLVTLDLWGFSITVWNLVSASEKPFTVLQSMQCIQRLRFLTQAMLLETLSLFLNPLKKLFVFN